VQEGVEVENVPHPQKFKSTFLGKKLFDFSENLPDVRGCGRLHFGRVLKELI